MKTFYANFRDGKIYLKDQIGKVEYTDTFTGKLTDLYPTKSTYSTKQWTFKFIDKDGDTFQFVGDNFNRSVITLINILSKIEDFNKPVTIKTAKNISRKGKEYTHIEVFYKDAKQSWNKHVPEIPRIDKDTKGSAQSDVDFQQMFLYLYTIIKENLAKKHDKEVVRRTKNIFK